MEQDYTLIDNTVAHRFEMPIDGQTPIIEYIKPESQRVIYFTHTEVPAALSGKGVAAIMTEKALKEVEEKGLQVVPLCPYTAAYIKRNPEWRRLVKPGFHV
jgi:predicted GNAT family acetyltransferase